MNNPTERVQLAGLAVAPVLHRFIEKEALPGLAVDATTFWQGLADLIHTFAPRNRALLDRRSELQGAIDSWHRRHQGADFDPAAYRAFLEESGYLQAEGPDFSIDTEHVDDEIAHIPGPQLVVPITNARYAINAANARWNSLYDALYGTDALGDTPSAGAYDPERGARVIAWTRALLDDVAPLASGSHANAEAYAVVAGHLAVTMPGAGAVNLRDPRQFVGFTGVAGTPASVLLAINNLHVELVIDRDHEVGRTDRAGIADVVVESAVTAIMDCEDSVATVDAEDKTLAYHNWLGLNRGDLTQRVTKDGATFIRTLAPDRAFTSPDGAPFTLQGRSLMLVRNVGHLTTTDAILDNGGTEIPEGLLDSMVTVLCAMHDIAKSDGPRSSHAGSIYVVKPKMHGPAEVAFTNDVFTHIEGVLGLAPNTVKLGIMDEERRTTLNLKECVRAAKSRVAFINTGFLDRTGDEIHTSIEAGPMVRKTAMRAEQWITAYEDWNVDIGLACGLPGRAQIGKGMWASPNEMARMLKEKIGHPQAGANCAWVPSPTAATLHATHYLRVDVLARQAEIAAGGRRATVDDLLHIPVAASTDWSPDEIREEIENNAQGILGYTVRWIDQGIGCSTVPDIHDVGLMEDRATCRISSQHIANWLHHRVVDKATVRAAFERMAAVVDRQNEADPLYSPMAPDFDGHAFEAALALVLEGREQPSGYTEPILHERRRLRKAELGGD
ncbi:MAG: malate synthase G [Chloroflexi bacterium]|nr:malate synthase G [Chloroflexota bacterium]MDA1146121.1 malate synthase G [Chloroflexota bacterium]